MRKLFFAALAALFCASQINAQVTVKEPDFINSYNILTSDSTFDTLPKENGEIKQRKNKIGKFAKIAGGISQLTGAAGIVGASAAGSAGGVVTGIRVASAASGVGSAADAIGGLAGANGMDIEFKGGKSSYQIEAGQDVRLLIKGERNDVDPVELYRIVRFKASKKKRSIKWMEIQPALIGTEEADDAGFVGFTGQKYGQQSYLLTLPAAEMVKGEYGIFYMSISTATAIPVGTFSVQ